MTPELITAISAAVVAILGAVAGFLTVLYKLGVIHNIVNSNLAEVNRRLDTSMAETKRLNAYIGALAPTLLNREQAQKSLKEEAE